MQSEPARSPRRLRALAVVALGAVLVAGVGGFAYASIPNSNSGVIYGCYVTSGASAGSLRVIDNQSGGACKAGETAIKWNALGINYRGFWKNTTAYGKGDAVLYQGQSYLAKVANTAVTPTDTTTWQLLAAKGAKGPKGAPGAPGPPGPPGPAGPKGAGSTVQALVGGIGPNDVGGAPSFVVPADETCLVTTTVQIILGIGQELGIEVARVENAASVNGAPFAQFGLGTGVMANGRAGRLDSVTVSSVLAVVAGDTIRFGAYIDPTPYAVDLTNSYGDVSQSYACS